MELIDPTDCPYYLISRVSLLMTSAFKKSFIAAGAGKVKPSYLGVLWCLWRVDGVKMIELGRCAGLEPSTMTGLLDRMERDGLVVRVADQDDRRAHLIHLTDDGRNVKTIVMRMLDETLAQVFMGISEEEIEQTNDVLRRVLNNARSESDE